MKQLISILCLIILTATAFAQSGRKSTPTPKATPAVIDPDDPSQYSESKPHPPRTLLRTQPPQSDGKRSQTGSTAQANSDQKDDGDILRVETNLISIPVSVFDRNGLYIPNLRQQDFRIFEDGVEQEIAYFGTSDKPFTVALVIDTSPSTEYKIEEIRRAATAFVDQLQPQDSVLVVEFNNSVKVRTPPTTDRQKIYDAIHKVNFGFNTSLYNAVDEVLRKQLAKIPGRKAMVLFTDGVDTTSRQNTYDSTVRFAEESDSLVFPIYYNTFFDNKGGLGGINGGVIPQTRPGINSPAGTTAAEYAVGKKYLEELADVTGGRVFRPESTPGGLAAAFEGIAEELRRQYNIGYVPKEEGRYGQRKQIKVRVNRPNLVLRARDSYIVGAIVTPPTTSAPK